MNKLIASSLMALVLALGSGAAAHESDEPSVGQALNEARLEGQLFATYALNRHLNPFDIKIDVNGNTAVLTGNVEDEVQKDLAEQIALGTHGIDKVDNRIQVAMDLEIQRSAGDGERDFGHRVADATTTATIKSKLLWNRNTDGTSINVTTKHGRVTLEGEAESATSKELAGRLAANTDGVESVENRLAIRPEPKDGSRDVADAVSDGWITTKVKSTLLFSANVSGRSINVDTRDGVVLLKGEVASGAEKDLAVKLAEDVRGVVGVDASGLQVTG